MIIDVCNGPSSNELLVRHCSFPMTMDTAHSSQRKKVAYLHGPILTRTKACARGVLIPAVAHQITFLASMLIRM